MRVNLSPHVHRLPVNKPLSYISVDELLLRGVVQSDRGRERKTGAEVRGADSQVAKVGVRGVPDLFKRSVQLGQELNAGAQVVSSICLRKQDDFDVIFKVYEHNEVMLVFDEHSTPDGVVVIDTRCIVQRRALDGHSDRLKPSLLLFFDASNLVILTIEFT